MAEATLVPAGGGEIVGDSARRRVEILADEERLCATWSRYGPRREGADLHIHLHHSDLFYVLDGELTVRLGSEDTHVTLGAGTLARVPPLVVHGFRNAGDGEVRYLNFHAPGMRFADFLRALRDGRGLAWDQHDPGAADTRPSSDAAVGGADVVADEPGARIAVLADVAEIGVLEVTGEASAEQPPPHVHLRHAESFYVLEGELTLAVGDRALRAGRGAWLHVPPGVAHAVTVAGPEPARFLDLHTPSCGLGALDEARVA